MAKYLADELELQSIANAIRAKGNTLNNLTFPNGFVNAITNISSGGNIEEDGNGNLTFSTDGDIVGKIPLTADTNGTYTAPSGKAYTPVSVNVQPVLEALSVTDNGNYTPGTGVDGFSSVSVNVSGGGGGSVASNAVNFRDYDGTIVASYSAADFANLSALPANPSHDGLTAQGWNWSITDAKAYVAKYGRLEVGQMYITTDGKTHVHIHLEQDRTSPMLGCCPNGTVDVDWGDGTAHDTLTGTSTSTVQWTPNHAYAAPGDYVIKLTVTGEMGFYGNNSTNQFSGLLRHTSNGDTRNWTYILAITKVEIGNNVIGVGDYAFYDCYNLSGVVIPNSVTSIGGYAFYDCYNLSGMVIPNNVTSIGSYAFYFGRTLNGVAIPNSVTSIGSNAFCNCYNLVGVTVPDSITNIESNCFQGEYSIKNFIVPDSVTSIASRAFQGFYSMVEYHLTPTIPPTLSNTNAFGSTPADCIFYVPYSADHSILNAYKTAANWSAYASQMQEEPA